MPLALLLFCALAQDDFQAGKTVRSIQFMLVKEISAVAIPRLVKGAVALDKGNGK